MRVHPCKMATGLLLTAAGGLLYSRINRIAALAGTAVGLGSTALLSIERESKVEFSIRFSTHPPVRKSLSFQQRLEKVKPEASFLAIEDNFPGIDPFAHYPIDRGFYAGKPLSSPGVQVGDIIRAMHRGMEQNKGPGLEDYLKRCEEIIDLIRNKAVKVAVMEKVAMLMAPQSPGERVSSVVRWTNPTYEGETALSHVGDRTIKMGDVPSLVARFGTKSEV